MWSVRPALILCGRSAYAFHFHTSLNGPFRGKNSVLRPQNGIVFGLNPRQSTIWLGPTPTRRPRRDEEHERFLQLPFCRFWLPFLLPLFDAASPCHLAGPDATSYNPARSRVEFWVGYFLKHDRNAEYILERAQKKC